MPLRVVHLNTSIGRSSAAYRISNAISEMGIDSTVLCLNSSVDSSHVITISTGRFFKILNYIENRYGLYVAKYIHSMMQGMPYSLGRIGCGNKLDKYIKDADIIHVHWVEKGMLSIRDIRYLLQSGKKVVFTTHDNWLMTGGCHVKYECDHYVQACGNCPLMNSNFKYDITYRTLLKKKRLWGDFRFTITSPSEWTNNNVKKSILFRNSYNVIIPNPVDVRIFKPTSEVKDKHVGKRILFGALDTIAPYKGAEFLKTAFAIISDRIKDNIELLIFGKNGNSVSSVEGIKAFSTGFIEDERELAKIYSDADVFVVPSLEDSFNQTVAECLACATPVVAFKTGGIVDIIDHKSNGYLADYKDANDLAEGIIWVLSEDKKRLGLNARAKIVNCYSYEIIGKKFADLYRGL